jgi:hypothetical protein
MSRMQIIFSVLLLSFTASNCRADTLPLFSDLPNPPLYTPGTPFTFQITLPDGLNGLSSYKVGLVFDTAVENPPLTVSAAPPSSGYVFPGSTNFTSNSFAGPAPNEVSIQFSDFISPNFILTAPGQDVLANITVNPDISLTGPITVSFTDYTFVSYFTESFDSPAGSVTFDQGTPPPPPVPTPAGWITLSMGALILAGRNRILRRS